MRKKHINVLLFAITCVFLYSCKTDKVMSYPPTKNYKPDNKELYDTIVKLDSLFFETYNNCETMLDKYSTFYADNIEFYHDQGGLMTDKKLLVDKTKENICGKVKRELIKGSIEVYPIKNFGAVEIGLHCFINNQEPANTPKKIGRFMIIWENSSLGWKIKRVVSLH